MQPAWPRAGIRLDDRKSTIYFDNYAAMHERPTTEYCRDGAHLWLALFESCADVGVLAAHRERGAACDTSERRQGRAAQFGTYSKDEVPTVAAAHAAAAINVWNLQVSRYVDHRYAIPGEKSSVYRSRGQAVFTRSK